MRKSMMTLCHKRLFSFRVLHNLPRNNVISTKDERQELMALWPNVVKDLTELDGDLNIPEVTTKFSKLLQYNVPNGKMSRGISLINAYKDLCPKDQLTDENIRLARILGWCCEMAQAFILMEDDIMDKSQSRRGKPCWYLQEDIGLSAIKDALFIEQIIFRLLKMHFRQKSYYPNVVELFHDGIYRTAVGQNLDMSLGNYGMKPNLNLFTMDRYKLVAKYKTSHCLFVLPLALAKQHAGIKYNEEFRQVDKLLIEIGNFYQVQDDYLDFYGDFKITGKTGTGIQEGKCTWLIVTALQRANSQQRQILEECYGENDPEKVARVRELYNDLELQTIYNNYEKDNYNLIKKNIQQESPEILHNFLFTLLNKVYRRSK